MKAMSQTRVVISDRLRPLAEELQAVTGVSSLSDVIALLLTKYSQHLKASWIESGMQILSPKTNTTALQPVQSETIYAPQNQEPQYLQQPEPIPQPEPKTDPDPEVDPVIQWIAKHVDTF